MFSLIRCLHSHALSTRLHSDRPNTSGLATPLAQRIQPKCLISQVVGCQAWTCWQLLFTATRVFLSFWLTSLLPSLSRDSVCTNHYIYKAHQQQHFERESAHSTAMLKLAMVRVIPKVHSNLTHHRRQVSIPHNYMKYTPAPESRRSATSSVPDT